MKDLADAGVNYLDHLLVYPQSGNYVSLGSLGDCYDCIRFIAKILHRPLHTVKQLRLKLPVRIQIAVSYRDKIGNHAHKFIIPEGMKRRLVESQKHVELQPIEGFPGKNKIPKGKYGMIYRYLFDSDSIPEFQFGTDKLHHPGVFVYDHVIFGPSDPGQPLYQFDGQHTYAAYVFRSYPSGVQTYSHLSFSFTSNDQNYIFAGTISNNKRFADKIQGLSHMNILVNARFTQYKTGVGRVVENILRQLSLLDDKNRYHIFANPEFKNLLTFNNPNFTTYSNNIPARDSLRNHLWTQTGLLRQIKKLNIDLLLLPQINLFLFKRVPTITIQHDLIEYKIPNQKWYKLAFRKFAFPMSMKLSDKIIAVSDNTAKDILEIFKVPPEKIEVIYNGVDPNFRRMNRKECIEKIKSKYAMANPFLLYVGILTHPQKNLLRLIEAFDVARKTHPVDLVLIGNRGKDSHLIFDKIRELGLENRVKCPGYITDDDLPAFLNAAQAFCFPSLYEGFGLPVLEAMKCGCPVVTSNTSSLPEVVGDTGITVNPYDVEEIASAISKVLSLNEKQREEFAGPAVKRAEKFSWESGARKLIDLINSFSRTRS